MEQKTATTDADPNLRYSFRYVDLFKRNKTMGDNMNGTMLALLRTNPTTQSNNFYKGQDDELQMDDVVDCLLFLFKSLLMLFIIVAALLGNLLVIISVMQHPKLRVVISFFTTKNTP